MNDKPESPDSGEIKGPGGLTLREIHEQVQKSVERDRQERVAKDSRAVPRNRWQRWVHYVWGRSGRR